LGRPGADDRETLSGFVATFPSRQEGIQATGLPDTLVHGDFHSGNARGSVSRGGTDPRLVLLDWGDCGVGHPLLDQAAYLDRIQAEEVPGVVDVWRRAWRRAIPGSDPSRAAALLAPVAAARQAVIYRRFLDGIEPSEHPYHRADPADWLRRTAAILRG
jgi:aminoglycoside phosphotransferase (APT) family kinase protein